MGLEIFGDLFQFYMKSIKAVMVPTDFSPTAWRAVLMGIRISLGNRSDLHLIHINPQEDREYQEEIREKLTHISENLSLIYSLSVKSTVISGEPTQAINAYIKSSEIDLIVMGQNGTGSNDLGSLTRLVLGNLTCPVMVVPQGKA